MKFSLNNIWLGNQESLNAIMALNEFLSSPTENAKSYFGYDDDDDGEEPRFDGIGSHLIQVEDSVGIIRISGSLTNRYSWFNRWYGVISYDEIRDALVSLASDEDIASILLEIDTGGGAAHGINEVSEVIKNIDKYKPVEAHTSMYTFSAGMWLASAARKISGSNMAEVGSVGVIITMMSYHEMYKKAGIEVAIVRAGKYKALGNPMEPLSEAVIKEAEGKADKLYNYFLETMVRNRSQLSLGNKDAWAEGKTFFVDEALPLGLIDEISSFDKVVAKLSANHDNTNQQAQFSANVETNLTTTTDGDDMGAKTTNKKAVLNESALAAAALGAEVETEEVEAPEAGAEAEAPTGDTPEAGAETPEAGADTSAPAANMDLTAFMGKLQDQATTIASLESKLQEAETKSATLEGACAALKPIAIQAISRLSVALGQTPADVEKLDASSLADMYAQTNKKFEESFNIGGPKSERLAEDREAADNTSTGFCQIHKPS